jgi:hypothetical protein
MDPTQQPFNRLVGLEGDPGLRQPERRLLGWATPGARTGGGTGLSARSQVAADPGGNADAVRTWQTLSWGPRRLAYYRRHASWMLRRGF